MADRRAEWKAGTPVWPKRAKLLYIRPVIYTQSPMSQENSDGPYLLLLYPEMFTFH
jgi:hypothetical protein